MDAESVRFLLKRGIESQDFKDELDALYAEKGDGLEVRYAEIVYTVEKANPTQFPCVEVVVTISRNLDPESAVERLQHEVHIYWMEIGSEEEELENRIGRYLVATRRFFAKWLPRQDSGIEPVTFGDDNYSPFIQADLYASKPLVKVGLTVMYVTTLS